ncbi:MAG: hypothetical protein LBS45_04520 [Synergistaceae bacterium]|jgi:hypothetical protein|nr:hypothetical protein [Synergistaceae bacterium]
MSHSLHRFGSRESLKDDFCIYARASKGINRDNCGDKLRRIFSIFLSEDFVNFGHGHAGKSYVDGLNAEEYAKTLDSSYGIIVNFGSREAVANVLRKLKEADTGLSIVVSGLIDEVVAIAGECGLTPHTASLSLGIYGDKSLIPEDEVLELTTMCGHSLIGNAFVRTVIGKVKKGGMPPADASILIARPCVCGIFNTRRCEKILSNI